MFLSNSQTFLVALFALGACGGGTGDSGGSMAGGPPGASLPLTQSAQAFASEPNSDALIGVQLNTPVGPSGLQAAQLATSTGLENAATGGIKLSDGSFFFASATGFDDFGIAKDDRSTRNLINTNRTYQTARIINGFDFNGNSPSGGLFLGVTGIAANPAQIGGTQGVIYNGDAVADLRGSSGSTFNFDNGTSRVTINFGDNEAEVDMRNFVLPADAPFDRVQITGMTVSGNRLTGGVVTTSLGGATVSVVGNNAASASAGVLLGAVISGAPDEVAGMTYMRGDDAALAAAFVAD